MEGIVRLLVKAGKYELAAEAVLQLEPVDLRDLALANLASQLGSEKRVEQAMKVANQIEDAKQKDVAFQLCAFSLERADEAKQAIGVAQKIENASMKEYVMNRIAKDVTAKGNLDAALELITNHYEPIQRGGLVDCVRILAMSGHMKQAMDATRKCRVLECRIRALSQIAIILATEPASTKQRTPPTSPPRRMKKDFSAEAARSVERLIELAKAAHN